VTGTTLEVRAMRAVTVAEAKHDLNRLIEQVIVDAEPAILITEDGRQVVLLPLDDYNAWQETRYLLLNSANAEHLRRSITESRAGAFEERELLDP
jgi:antitoxin YefM